MKNNLFALALLFVVLHDNTLNAQWANLGSGISASDRALAGIFPVNENVLWGFTWHAFNFTPTHEITRSVDGGQTWMPGVLAGVSSEQFPIYIFPYD